jgi:heterotetrameric sarcosine oxidase alpha subunit
MGSRQRYRVRSAGGVDRGRELTFTFDGRELRGLEGDTLASALLANGVRLVGRSFKYHRPRGIFSAGPEEPNALVELREGAAREPNTKATTVELFDGLSARSQNRWPSLRRDLRALNGLFSPLLVAGFYYKTFMWPGWAWEKLYEPLIRKAAGLGRASGEPDPDSYEKANAFCDVLVIGSGPAGLAAASAAAAAGARVILCEEDFRFGGRLLAERAGISGMASHAWAARTVAQLAARPHVRLMSRTSVFGAFDGRTWGAVERVNDHRPSPPLGQPRQRLWRIVARHTVVATGAVEQPIAFPGNDRPGVMLAGSVRTYLNRHGVTPGRRVAVFTNNDDAWRTAADLAAHGIEVPVIVDTRNEVAADVRSAIRQAHAVIGGVVSRARGGHELEAIDVRSDSGIRRFAVDTLAVSGGWNPLIALCGHRGVKPVWNEASSVFLPAGASDELSVAGSARGVMTLRACLEDGGRHGARAAQACGLVPHAIEVPEAVDEPAARSAYWHVPGKGKSFVDQQHDVTVDDIVLAHREGYRSPEHLKRYTTLGMGTDQGSTANVLGLALLAELEGRRIADMAPIASRPPAAPVAIGAFAGPHRGRESRPTRFPPSHEWAAAQGAVFMEVGLWLRAQYFPKPGERDWLESVTREVRAVREGVGFCDVSTLGKIDLFGSDVGTFLDRIYANTFSTLPEGKMRYGVMLREDGFVLDDGTTSRLSANHYYMTTTTAHAVKVMQHLEYCHQVLWPELDVAMVSATDQWAQFAIAGPRSRELLARLVDPGYDVSREALPFMGVREVAVCGGLQSRVFRVSFSGELAFELAVPAAHGAALAQRLMGAGESLGVTPYGLEALGVMRIEKGFVAGGELNGQTTAGDLGLASMVSPRKDCIGRTMAARPALNAADRPALAGFRPADRSSRLHAGAHFVALDARPGPASDEGYLTSVAFSPTLGGWIGLGLVKGGARRAGERIRACDPLRGNDVEVEICAPNFFDPQGERMRA